MHGVERWRALDAILSHNILVLFKAILNTSGVNFLVPSLLLTVIMLEMGLLQRG
jgi:hypothetical protein